MKPYVIELGTIDIISLVGVVLFLIILFVWVTVSFSKAQMYLEQSVIQIEDLRKQKDIVIEFLLEKYVMEATDRADYETRLTAMKKAFYLKIINEENHWVQAAAERIYCDGFVRRGVVSVNEDGVMMNDKLVKEIFGEKKKE